MCTRHTKGKVTARIEIAARVISPCRARRAKLCVTQWLSGPDVVMATRPAPLMYRWRVTCSSISWPPAPPWPHVDVTGGTARHPAWPGAADYGEHLAAGQCSSAWRHDKNFTVTALASRSGGCHVVSARAFAVAWLDLNFPMQTHTHTHTSRDH